MELEYELENVLEEEANRASNVCPTCGSKVIGDYCHFCRKNVPTEKYYDPNFEEYFNKIEKEGEEFEKSKKDASQWVSVIEDKGSFG